MISESRSLLANQPVRDSSPGLGFDRIFDQLPFSPRTSTGVPLLSINMILLVFVLGLSRRLAKFTLTLKINLKSTLSHNFKRNGYTKKSRSFEILGCSYVDFKEYIESQFEDWMSWDNYGLYNGEEKYGWDLDHIVPLSSAECEGDIIRLNHYSNIQPLCSYVNRDVKRDNIDWKS